MVVPGYFYHDMNGSHIDFDAHYQWLAHGCGYCWPRTFRARTRPTRSHQAVIEGWPDDSFERSWLPEATSGYPRLPEATRGYQMLGTRY